MDYPLRGYIKDLSMFHSIFQSRSRRSFEMNRTLSNLQRTFIIMSRMYLSTSIIKWYHFIRSVRFFMYMDWRDINDECQSLQFTLVFQWVRSICHWGSRTEIVDDRVGKIYDSVMLNNHRVSCPNHWNESVVSSWIASDFHMIHVHSNIYRFHSSCVFQQSFEINDILVACVPVFIQLPRSLTDSGT
jgi:hypothetical protein